MGFNSGFKGLNSCHILMVSSIFSNTVLTIFKKLTFLVLGRLRQRWYNNIKMVHKDTDQSVDWISMAHDMNQWRALVTMLFTIRLQK